jgi:hypothetical protein
MTKKIVKDGGSQFQNFHVNFHKFHTLFSTDYQRLGYHKFCIRWVPNMLTGMHNKQRMALAFFRVISQRFMHSPHKPKQFKQILSARTLMTTVSWDKKGVVVEFMQQGTIASRVL